MKPLSSWLVLAILVMAFTVQAQTLKTHVAKPVPAVVPRNLFQNFPSFSATLSGGIAKETGRKIYRSGKLLRVDFDDHYRLVDLDKLTTRFVYPNSCRTIGFPDAASYPISAYYGFNVQRAPTEDKETAEGHASRIVDVTLTSPTKGDEQPTTTIKMKLWEAEDLNGFPVKAEIDAGHDHKFTVNYSDVSLAQPDKALFQSPAVCPGGEAGGWQKVTPGKPALKPTPKPSNKSSQ